MIAFAKGFFWKKPEPRIRFRWPHETVVITGCPFEKIDAEYDQQDKLKKLIIYTRRGNLGRGKKKSFFRS